LQFSYPGSNQRLVAALTHEPMLAILQRHRHAAPAPMAIPQPHDVFVRDFLADLDQARDFFRMILPPAFLAEFNLDALHAEPTSLIDETSLSCNPTCSSP